jgi:8-oxo-dGTP pyrophosphatase MutT (NUDIX family)
LTFKSFDLTISNVLIKEKIMSNRPYRIGTGAIIINDNKQILFFERADKLGWQPPHGGLEENETMEEC